MTDLSDKSQLAFLHDRMATRALHACSVEMQKLQPEILSVSKARLLTGADVFGTKMFEQDGQQLRVERVQEYADAVNYMIAIMRKTQIR